MTDAEETSQHEANSEASDGAGHGGHAIHLPSNSWTPLTAALALALVFVGLLSEIRNTIGPTMWVIGLVLLVASLAVWARGARTEYLSLPEDQEH
jgi:hypothetical protein